MINIEKTEEEITSNILTEVPNTYQKTVGFLAWDFIRAVAVELKSIWDMVSYLCGFGDLNNFEYDDLVKFVKQRRGIIAKTATSAIGDITVINGAGNINIGDLFETVDGLQFKSIETKQVSTNDTFKAECMITGLVGNVPVGAVCIIPSTIQGIVSISNLTEFKGGYDSEDKSSIIERYLEDLQRPITSGNVYHYHKWAKEVPGVGNAKIKPLWNGDNTVKIIIIDSNYQYADDSLVSDVQDYIAPYTLDSDGNKIGWGCGNGQAPIGAYCTVESAIKLKLNITAQIKLMVGANLDEVKVGVEKSINSYLKQCAFTESYVSYAKIGSCILSTDGVKDYSNLILNNDTDNVAINDTSTSCEIAVLDTLTLTEVI